MPELFALAVAMILIGVGIGRRTRSHGYQPRTGDGAPKITPTVGSGAHK